jgi:hypothetical protein
MATSKSPNSNRNPNPLPTLADRVKERVAEAELYFDQQPSTSFTDASQAHRETQSLRKVYCEMRSLYRAYRRATGRPAVPELRSAVQAFRRGSSLKSLVHIASFLDDRKLLAW